MFILNLQGCKLKQQRDEILLTKNLVKLDAFNKIRKEYIELIILGNIMF